MGPDVSHPDGYARLLHGHGQYRDAVEVKMLAGVVQRSPFPQTHNDGQRFVQPLCSLAWGKGLPEAAEFPPAIAAQTDAEYQAPAAQLVERYGLAGDDPGSPAGQGRDHCSESQRAGGAGHRRKRDPWVRDRHDVPVQHVIPEEDALPAGLFGAMRDRAETAGIGEFTERRDVETEMHAGPPGRST